MCREFCRPKRRASNVHLVYAFIHSLDTISQYVSHPTVLTSLSESEGGGMSEEANQNEQAQSPSAASAQHFGSHATALDTVAAFSTSTYSRSGGIGMHQYAPALVASIWRYFRILEGDGDDGQRKNLLSSASTAISALREVIEEEQSADVAIDSIQSDDAESTGAGMTYTYVEGDNPEDFFVPCAWAAAVSIVHTQHMYNAQLTSSSKRKDPL